MMKVQAIKKHAVKIENRDLQMVDKKKQSLE
jgi:hypothetical protein